MNEITSWKALIGKFVYFWENIPGTNKKINIITNKCVDLERKLFLDKIYFEIRIIPCKIK